MKLQKDILVGVIVDIECVVCARSLTTNVNYVNLILNLDLTNWKFLEIEPFSVYTRAAFSVPNRCHLRILD